MNSEWGPIVVAFVMSLPGLAALVLSARKQNSEAYAALLNALHTSGQTIDDLFKMLEELPDMKRELDEMKRERAEWELGIGILLAQIGDLHQTPRWKPKIRSVNQQVNTQ